MNRKEITDGRRKLQVAGGIADWNQIRQTLRARARTDIDLLNEHLQASVEEFRRYLEAWLTIDASKASPHPLTDDLRTSHLYRFASVAALIGELGLAGWFFFRNGVPPLAGAASVLIITAVLHALIHYLAFGPVGRVRPRQVLYDLRQFIRPAGAAFFVAMVLGTLPRYLFGPLAASQEVHNALSAGLLIGTVSLLILSAAFNVASLIFGISKPLSDRYSALRLELEITKAFLGELDAATPPRAPGVQAPETRQVADDVRATIALPLVLLCACLAGCTQDGVSAAAVSPVSLGEGCQIDAELDTSGSPMQLRESWTNFHERELPRIVTESHCQQLNIATFSSSGWIPTTKEMIAIPQLQVGPAANVHGEWSDMANVKEAQAELDREALDKATARWMSEIKAFQGVVASLDIQFDQQSRATDIVGLLQRLSRYPIGSDRIVFVFSDFGDTARQPVREIPSPPDGVLVVGLVLPMKESDAKKLKIPLELSRQYEDRVQWLAQVAPWVHAVPFFSQRLASLLPESRVRPLP